MQESLKTTWVFDVKALALLLSKEKWCFLEMGFVEELLFVLFLHSKSDLGGLIPLSIPKFCSIEVIWDS